MSAYNYFKKMIYKYLENISVFFLKPMHSPNLFYKMWYAGILIIKLFYISSLCIERKFIIYFVCACLNILIGISYFIRLYFHNPIYPQICVFFQVFGAVFEAYHGSCSSTFNIQISFCDMGDLF